MKNAYTLRCTVIICFMKKKSVYIYINILININTSKKCRCRCNARSLAMKCDTLILVTIGVCPWGKWGCEHSVIGHSSFGDTFNPATAHSHRAPVRYTSSSVGSHTRTPLEKKGSYVLVLTGKYNSLRSTCQRA